MIILMLCVTIFVILVVWFILPFFFQAEDGIRDLYVTGVQTCALPISRLWDVQTGKQLHALKWQPSGFRCYARSARGVVYPSARPTGALADHSCLSSRTCH